MKRLAFSVSALALLSGLAMAAPAQAGSISHRERAAIAKSQHHVAAVKRQAWANGSLSVWERMRIRAAEAHRNRVVARARND